MSAFNLQASLERARQRLGEASAISTRRPRSDKGKSRIGHRVINCIAQLTSGQERPPMQKLLRDLKNTCRKKNLPVPSRATVYKLLYGLPLPKYKISKLLPSVQAALYNMNLEKKVPAGQMAFHCFNYGTIDAVSFAAGLPWLVLFQALKLRGYREKSRGLIEAVARARGI